MKQQSITIALFAFALFSSAVAVAKDDGFQKIFNGRDLSGWDGREGAWTVENGAIKCTGDKEGGKNWLIWRGGEPSDFELRLKFRYTAGNSGVQVRSEDLGNHQVRGYQVEVAPQDKMGLWHHSLSPEPYRGHLATAGQKSHITPDGEKTRTQVEGPEKVQAAFKEGEWNELVVIAEGPKLVQIINGVVFSELVDEDKKYSTRTGLLAFQDHGKGTITEFKDIRLKTK